MLRQLFAHGGSIRAACKLVSRPSQGQAFINRGEVGLKTKEFNRIMTEWTVMTVIHYCLPFLCSVITSSAVCGWGVTVYRGHNIIKV